MDDTERTSQDINTVAGRILSEGTAPKTQGDERRRSLVQAAYHLIAEGGFERLRTRDIAARAGVNIATLHYYFARKEDLIRSVVEFLLRQFMTAYLPGSPYEMETSSGANSWRACGAAIPLARKAGHVHRFRRTCPSFALHDPAILHMIKWLDEGWHTYLEQVIRSGIEQGLFPVQSLIQTARLPG